MGVPQGKIFGPLLVIHAGDSQFKYSFTPEDIDNNREMNRNPAMIKIVCIQHC